MLNILCALHCEARPLIQRFGLKPSSKTGPFPIYRNETTRLAICGIGKVAAAAATGFLGALCDSPCSWLNVGIAGHTSLPTGYAALAHSIADAASSKKFYPDIALVKGLLTVGVVTVDKPATEYPEQDLIEMEASGFYQIAQRFSTVDLIHCLKVVSDNPRNPSDTIKKGVVQELIIQSLPAIERLIDQVHPLIPTPPLIDLAPYLKHCRWTETEKHQLERLLLRWKAMGESPPPCQHLDNSKEILKHLEHTLNQLPLCFTPSTSKKR